MKRSPSPSKMQTGEDTTVPIGFDEFPPDDDTPPWETEPSTPSGDKSAGLRPVSKHIGWMVHETPNGHRGFYILDKVRKLWLPAA